MSRIKTYTTYTEVTNGLFVDIPDEKFLFIETNMNEGLHTIFGNPFELVEPRQRDRQMVVHTNSEGMRQFQQALEQEVNIQILDMNSVANMSEAETIQYLDRISEENE